MTESHEQASHDPDEYGRHRAPVDQQLPPGPSAKRIRVLWIAFWVSVLAALGSWTATALVIADAVAKPGSPTDSADGSAAVGALPGVILPSVVFTALAVIFTNLRRSRG